MKASELVEKLHKLIKEHGDQRVYMYNSDFEDGGRVYDVEYTDVIEEAHYYQSDAPGEGPGICIKGR